MNKLKFVARGVIWACCLSLPLRSETLAQQPAASGFIAPEAVFAENSPVAGANSQAAAITPVPPPPVAAQGEEMLVISREELRRLVAEMTQEQTISEPQAAEPQTSQIETLKSEWQKFQKKQAETVYPNTQVHGVFQADAGWFHQDAQSLDEFGRIEDGADFRRFRLSANGSLVKDMNYFTQVDFGFFGRPTLTDVWLEQANIPGIGTIRVGQWKQPFSLEVVSSFRYTTFMERSVLFQPFTPFRHIGVGFYNKTDDLSATWAASVFRSGQDQFGGSISTDGGWGTAERITWLPEWECDGRHYLHLGVGHFFNSPPHDRAVFRTIPEFFVGHNGPGAVGTSGQAVPGGLDGTPFFVSTGALAVSSYNVLGTELLWVRGPLSIQSEVMINAVDQVAANTVVLPGFYAQVGYFLTGEHRPYDRKAGAIDRVKPRRNLKFGGCGDDCGWGAWEVAARLSYLDLNDKDLVVTADPNRAGTLTDFTAGINWFLNPNAKLVFNYVHAVPDTPAFPKSQTDIFGVRAQMDF